ncbi:uncharacterized protein LOC132746866 [Ruditapes philippinarum]|uniref:uncharacterized protein LOC132746866 n=1 Tax=Ruditapes philippinarum TaxID=129788 RepID=UPI00295B1E92|nr:uncharacterized protein LOC132746866 [Ruditapes philippinarum]
MRTDKKWSDAVLKLVSELNNFDYADPSGNRAHTGCVPFYIDGNRVGVIPAQVMKELPNYPDVFKICTEQSGQCVYLSEQLSTEVKKSDVFERVLMDLRKQEKFVTLKGWRNEKYSIFYKLGEPPICHVERAGCPLFGFIQYGVHVNGYTYKDGELKMWVGRRSKTKQTFPNMLDNMCAGGLTSGLGITECTIKECQEEGSVDDETLKKLKPIGSISYCYIDDRGIEPETQYLYDLELSPDFVPRNADGEMQSFHLYSLEELQDLIIAEEFKPNCALTIIDFLIRHGYITPDNEPNYCYIIQRMHISLQPSP